MMRFFKTYSNDVGYKDGMSVEEVLAKLLVTQATSPVATPSVDTKYEIIGGTSSDCFAALKGEVFQYGVAVVNNVLSVYWNFDNFKEEAKGVISDVDVVVLDKNRQVYYISHQLIESINVMVDAFPIVLTLKVQFTTDCGNILATKSAYLPAQACVCDDTFEYTDYKVPGQRSVKLEEMLVLLQHRIMELERKLAVFGSISVNTADGPRNMDVKTAIQLLMSKE